MITWWHKLRALPAADRRLVARTGLLLILVRIGLWVLPFRALRRLLGGIRPSGHESTPLDPDFPGRLAWAVAVLSRRLPGMTCLVQCLVADALLRRAGRRPELRIGVRAPAERGPLSLAAHAWVECDGRIVAGDVGDLPEYRVMRPAVGRAIEPPARAP